jgi:hypothetical protein
VCAPHVCGLISIVLYFFSHELGALLGSTFLRVQVGEKYRFSCSLDFGLSGPLLRLCGAEGEELLNINVLKRQWSFLTIQFSAVCTVTKFV